MAWAVPFAGNLVRDFQYGHFRYWNVPPRRDKIAYEHGTLVLVPKMSHQKKKFKNDKFGFFLIFALVIQHWTWVLLLDSLLECLTKVIQGWLRPGWLIKCLTEKKKLYDGLYERSYFWKMSKIISIFDQKIGVYEGIFAFWRPGRPLRGQKFYQETSIWSSGYVPRVKK